MLGQTGLSEEKVTDLLDALISVEGAKSDSVRLGVDSFTFADPTLKTYSAVEDAVIYLPASLEKRNWVYSNAALSRLRL